MFSVKKIGCVISLFFLVLFSRVIFATELWKHHVYYADKASSSDQLAKAACHYYSALVYLERFPNLSHERSLVFKKYEYVIMRSGDIALATRERKCSIPGRRASAIARITCDTILLDKRGIGIVRRQLPIQFEYNSTGFSDKGKQNAVILAECLKQKQITKLKLIGHTDERGSESYNLTLSEDRANALKNYLKSENVRASILTEGKGESQPTEQMPNESLENKYTRDRRVEVITYPNDQSNNTYTPTDTNHSVFTETFPPNTFCNPHSSSEVKRLIQEYKNSSKSHIPSPDEFVSASCYKNPGSFSFTEISKNRYEWVIFSIGHHLQNIRNKVNQPLKISSAYRSPKHNSSVGGASESQHMYGKAADVITLDFNNNGRIDSYDKSVLEQHARDEGADFIARYPSTRHIHMDWRCESTWNKNSSRCGGS